MSIGNFLNADDCHLKWSPEDVDCAAIVAHDIQAMFKEDDSDPEEDEGPTLPSNHCRLDALHLAVKINEARVVVSLHLARALRFLKRDVKQLKNGQQR